MRALLQRVTQASVAVDGQTVGAIDAGLLVLLCVVHGDGPAQAARLAGKIASLRIFADAAGKMNESLLDQQGSCLLVSQFTLAADARKGNRPSFAGAADPDSAAELCAMVATELENLGVPVRTGAFGADMQVQLLNDGPVTIWLDTEHL